MGEGVAGVVWALHARTDDGGKCGCRNVAFGVRVGPDRAQPYLAALCSAVYFGVRLLFTPILAQLLIVVRFLAISGFVVAGTPHRYCYCFLQTDQLGAARTVSQLAAEANEKREKQLRAQLSLQVQESAERERVLRVKLQESTVQVVALKVKQKVDVSNSAQRECALNLQVEALKRERSQRSSALMS